MKRNYLEPALLGVVLLAIVVAAGHQFFRGKSQPLAEMKMSDQHYSTDLKELRDLFNKEKGKVRLVLLLSPT
jgi:hypothetical protein